MGMGSSRPSAPVAAGAEGSSLTDRVLHRGSSNPPRAPGNATSGRDRMIMTTGGAGTQATCQEMAEESIRVIAEGLTKRGLTVRTTGCVDSRLLKVTGPRNAACDVIVAEDYYFTCEYTPDRNREADPAGIVRIVARMLGMNDISPRQYAPPHRGITPLGAVGREMKARGMTVTLDVMEDDETYSVFAAVVITNPAHPERGKVHLENGWVYWECYGDE